MGLLAPKLYEDLSNKLKYFLIIIATIIFVQSFFILRRTLLSELKIDPYNKRISITYRKPWTKTLLKNINFDKLYIDFKEATKNYKRSRLKIYDFGRLVLVIEDNKYGLPKERLIELKTELYNINTWHNNG